MKTVPRYLYGDSTPSTLTTNYIALIRELFDFSVEVLVHEHRRGTAAQEVENLSRATDAEIGKAEALLAQVGVALDQTCAGPSESIAARCAARIRKGVEDLVHSESAAARAVVAMEATRAAQVALHAHGACSRAFEKLVLRQELPEAAVSMKVWTEGQSHYAVRLHGQTPYGLAWTADVAVPAQHALGHALRIASVIEHLEVEAPEPTGWLRKEIKIRRQRLDRLYLTELAVDGAGTTVKLRATSEPSSPGYDIAFSDAPAHVQLLRIAGDPSTEDLPWDASETDAAALWSLRDSLVEMLEELAENKQSLVVASLDGTPLNQLETPRALVERLIDAVAPTVREIQRLSLVPEELALKRVLSETQREEVFVSKAELAKKLEPLPMSMRRVFDPLTLWDEPGGPATAVRDAPTPPTGAKPTAAAPAAVPVVATAAPAAAAPNEAGVPHGRSIQSLSAGALRGRDWHGDARDGAGSTGKWPALRPAHVASLPT